MPGVVDAHEGYQHGGFPGFGAEQFRRHVVGGAALRVQAPANIVDRQAIEIRHAV